MMELLGAAEKSTNPAITRCALKIAEATGKHQRSQNLKIHPSLVALLSTLLVVAAIAGCWYAFTHYAPPVAEAISAWVFVFVLVLVALYALLSGALSQALFVRLLESALSWVKKHNPLSSKTVDDPQGKGDGDSSD
jgi:hypothetical protein